MSHFTLQKLNPIIVLLFIVLWKLYKNFAISASEDKGCLPFTWENRKFQLENQMVRATPFGKLQKIWAVI